MIGKDETKKCAKNLFKKFGPIAKRIGGGSGRSRILTYHSVGERDHDMNVAPDDFAEQMSWLSNNARPIGLAQAAEGVAGVAITFDDGYRDNLVNAAPVLESLGIPATFFVVPGRVGGTLDHDGDPGRAALMDWPELEKLAAMGLEIGAHTMTHRPLARLDEPEQHAEIVLSKSELEEKLGRPVFSFAYPFGSAADFDETSVWLARKAGFLRAVTNRYGTNGPDDDRYRLRRIWIDRSDDIESFVAKVDGSLDALAVMDTALGLCARHALNRVTGRR